MEQENVERPSAAPVQQIILSIDGGHIHAYGPFSEEDAEWKALWLKKYSSGVIVLPLMEWQE